MRARVFISTLLASCALFSTALAAAPANDNIGRALGIGTNQTVRGENKGATRETWEASYSGVFQGKSVWWYLDVPENGRLTIKTEGSNFDTVLLAFTYASGRFLPAALNDNAGNGISWSQLSLSALKGTRYYLAVDGAGGAEGQIVLSVNRGEGSTNIAGTPPSPSSPNTVPAAKPPVVTKAPMATPAPTPAKTPSPATPTVTPPPKTGSSTTIVGAIPRTIITSAGTPDDNKPGFYPRPRIQTSSPYYIYTPYESPTAYTNYVLSSGAIINNGTRQELNPLLWWLYPNPSNTNWNTAFDLNSPADLSSSKAKSVKTSIGGTKLSVQGRTKLLAAPGADAWYTNSPFNRVTYDTGGPLIRGYSAWWRWTAPQDGKLALDTHGSDPGTTLCVFDQDVRTAVYVVNGSRIDVTMARHGLGSGVYFKIMTPSAWAGVREVTRTGPDTFSFPNPNPPTTGVMMGYSNSTDTNRATNVKFRRILYNYVDGFPVNNPNVRAQVVDDNNNPVPHGYAGFFGFGFDFVRISEPKEWISSNFLIVSPEGGSFFVPGSTTSFTFDNPNPPVSGSLTCSIETIFGGIVSNPVDGRRLLALNDDVSNRIRTSYVGLPARKGVTYYICVDVDRVSSGIYGWVSRNGTVANATIQNINVGEIKMMLDFTPQPTGLSNLRNLNPSINVLPAYRSVAIGDVNATFQSTANVIPPIVGYQWYKNGTIMIGQNNSSLTLAGPITAADHANYTVRVIDQFGIGTSPPASLNVLGFTSFSGTGYNSTIPAFERNGTLIINGTGLAATTQIEIVDTSGRTLSVIPLTGNFNATDTSITINLDAFTYKSILFDTPNSNSSSFRLVRISMPGGSETSPNNSTGRFTVSRLPEFGDANATFGSNGVGGYDRSAGTYSRAYGNLIVTGNGTDFFGVKTIYFNNATGTMGNATLPSTGVTIDPSGRFMTLDAASFNWPAGWANGTSRTIVFETSANRNATTPDITIDPGIPTFTFFSGTGYNNNSITWNNATTGTGFYERNGTLIFNGTNLKMTTRIDIVDASGVLISLFATPLTSGFTATANSVEIPTDAFSDNATGRSIDTPNGLSNATLFRRVKVTTSVGTVISDANGSGRVTVSQAPVFVNAAPTFGSNGGGGYDNATATYTRANGPLIITSPTADMRGIKAIHFINATTITTTSLTPALPSGLTIDLFGRFMTFSNSTFTSVFPPGWIGGNCTITLETHANRNASTFWILTQP